MTSSNPFTETTRNLDQLTGTELDRAHAAANYLLGNLIRERITDASLLAKLSSLRSDLAAEQEDRRKLARS